MKGNPSQCGDSRGQTDGMVIRMGSIQATDMADIAPGALGAADDLSGSPAR